MVGDEPGILVVLGQVPVGRVGPGGEYAGIHAGVKLRTRKRRAEYYVGVSAGRRIASPY